LADFISHIRAPQLGDAFAESLQHAPDHLVRLRDHEKADRLLMVEASFDWDDVGGWRAVSAYLVKDETKMPPIGSHDSVCER